MSEVKWLIEFGKQLEYLLEYTNTTREEIADFTGVSQASISRYINGLQMPSVDTIVDIAVELDSDIDDLVNFGESVH